MKPGVRRLIEELRGARVLVIHPRDAEGEALIDQLRRIGCNVQGVWPPPASIPHDIDTVFQIVETSEDTIFPTSAGEHPVTLVAIVDYENPTILKRCSTATPTASSTSRSALSASSHRSSLPDRCGGIRDGWKARCRSWRRP
jgi:AmiR/NasT family two-component response regulator